MLNVSQIIRASSENHYNHLFPIIRDVQRTVRKHISDIPGCSEEHHLHWGALISLTILFLSTVYPTYFLCQWIWAKHHCNNIQPPQSQWFAVTKVISPSYNISQMSRFSQAFTPDPETVSQCPPEPCGSRGKGKRRSWRTNQELALGVPAQELTFNTSTHLSFAKSSQIPFWNPQQ